MLRDCCLAFYMILEAARCVLTTVRVDHPLFSEYARTRSDAIVSGHFPVLWHCVIGEHGRCALKHQTRPNGPGFESPFNLAPRFLVSCVKFQPWAPCSGKP